MRTKIEEYDKDSIVWDLEQLSIFFPEPIEVEVPGYKPVTVGKGFGGFSWTMFTRGFQCTICGGCCRAPKSGDFSRRCWYWYESESRPQGQTKPVIVLVNGDPLTLYVHLNNRSRACDFLDEMHWVEPGEEYDLPTKIELVENEVGLVPQQHCTIHDGRQPSHCLWSPGTETFSTGKSRILLLSRRLPGRNWAWPKCPVDVSNFPIREQDIALDRQMLTLWADSTRHLTGSHIDRAVSLWEQATYNASVGQPPSESIQFAKVWS